MVIPVRRLWIALAACVVIGGAAAAWSHWSAERRDNEILALLPDEVLKHPDLVALAVSEAKPVYAAKCAACHGASLKGDVRTGAPNLSDNVWLYGTGRITDIERTILYGIRSGHPKGHMVTEMPGFGLRGLLTPAEISDVVQYVLALSKQPNLEEAAISGRAIYLGKGNCSDCHGDGTGDSDYGSANLTINLWNNGGGESGIYHSIYYGLAHSCPAWYGTLPLEKIRALAVWLYTVSHAAAAPATYTAQS